MEVGSLVLTSAPSHRGAFACILNWWFVLAMLRAPWMAWAAKQALPHGDPENQQQLPRYQLKCSTAGGQGLLQFFPEYPRLFHISCLCTCVLPNLVCVLFSWLSDVGVWFCFTVLSWGALHVQQHVWFHGKTPSVALHCSSPLCVCVQGSWLYTLPLSSPA